MRIRSSIARVALTTVLAAAGLVPFFAPPASAHGDCWVWAHRPVDDGRFHAYGEFGCGPEQHARIRVRAELLYSFRKNGKYKVIATDVVVRRRATGAKADASVGPCSPGQGYYKTRMVARVFNVADELVHVGRDRSAPRRLPSCVI